MPREGGLDGVEVCAGFGYLPTQFLSGARQHAAPTPTAARSRTGCGSCARCSRRCGEGIGPGGAVGCRLTDESGSFDGTDSDDVIEAAGVVADDGLADYISVALGGSSTYRGSTWIVPPPPAARNAIADFARRFKPRVGVPVIATGRILDPADADRLIGEGVCDAVGMTRAMIADPNLARKTLAGEPVTVCIGCNQGCIGHYHAGIPIACTVNPWTGYEAHAAPAATRRRDRETVVVVGAGPAGCAAAAAAAACGHRVVVLERGHEPGGQMRLALGAPGHARDRRAA